jgi:hypothetical protein
MSSLTWILVKIEILNSLHITELNINYSESFIFDKIKYVIHKLNTNLLFYSSCQKNLRSPYALSLRLFFKSTNQKNI